MLKHLQVTKVNLDPHDYVKRTALESDYTPAHLIKESCILVYEGRPIVIYKNLDEEGFNSFEIVQALQKVNYYTETRSGGLKTTSRIFGFNPRNTVRKDFCSSTSLALESPKEHQIVCDYAKKVASLYSETAPDVYQQHKELADKVLKDWTITDSPFTSGIINKNNPLKYHYDSGNFNNVYSCMLAFKHNVSGGYLALPEYDCALEIGNNSVLIFDGQSILHGVTPIKYLSDDAYRYTIVYYSLKRMWDCLPLSEEIIRIRNLKTKREEERAAGGNEGLKKQLEKIKERGTIKSHYRDAKKRQLHEDMMAEAENFEDVR